MGSAETVGLISPSVQSIVLPPTEVDPREHPNELPEQELWLQICFLENPDSDRSTVSSRVKFPGQTMGWTTCVKLFPNLNFSPRKKSVPCNACPCSVASVVSNSARPHGLQPTRFLHPWDFPGKSTGVGCHCLLLPYTIYSNTLDKMDH